MVRVNTPDWFLEGLWRILELLPEVVKVRLERCYWPFRTTLPESITLCPYRHTVISTWELFDCTLDWHSVLGLMRYTSGPSGVTDLVLWNAQVEDSLPSVADLPWCGVLDAVTRLTVFMTGPVSVELANSCLDHCSRLEDLKCLTIGKDRLVKPSSVLIGLMLIHRESASFLAGPVEDQWRLEHQETVLRR